MQKDVKKKSDETDNPNVAGNGKGRRSGETKKVDANKAKKSIDTKVKKP